jgi:hypothetical protein
MNHSMISPECRRNKHNNCSGSFKVREKGEVLIVFCSCVCHKEEVATVI